MRFTLKPYQTKAAGQILQTLKRSRGDWHEHGERTAFALSSTTGSGKTVIAAAVIEALLRGSEEFGFEADPSAVVLWVSKDPNLNKQTRARFVQCADQIRDDLVMLDKSFGEESLQTGVVYFINPDKLSKASGFAKPTPKRQTTFWTIIDATINDPKKTLYMVLDEAHEGMKAPSADEKTIVQKIINGNGDNVAVPVVWGISATVDRFNRAMEKSSAFIKRPNITIDPKDVQDSGLLKNALTLDIPDEDGDFETTMVRDAALDFADVSRRWDDYCEREQVEYPVKPLLVIQIPNRVAGDDDEKGIREENELIHRVLETVRKHWPEMPDDGIAHVIGQRGLVELGAYEIPRIEPQHIQGSEHVRVLIAKDAVSTGWDCPRAEVLVSLRPGKDHTYVTQLLGRMVRTPLAQATSEERLNTASCYLPRFDKETAKAVAEEMMGMRAPKDGSAPGVAVAKVLLKPVTLGPNPHVSDDVRKAITELPSLAKPAAAPKPIKRLLKASQAFAFDSLVVDADEVAHNTLFAVLDGVVSDRREELDRIADDIMTAEVRRLSAVRGGQKVKDDTDSRDADAATVDDELRHLRRMLSQSVVNRYIGRELQEAFREAVEAGGDQNDVDVTEVRARVAALAKLPSPADGKGVQELVEDAANALVQLWLTSHDTALKKVKDSRKPTYDAIRDLARDPEPSAVELKDDDVVDTVDTDGNRLPLARLHVLSDDNGDFPIDKAKNNSWERSVIAQETASGSPVVGWYRNPSSAGKNSLRIPFKDSSGVWRSVQPDIILVEDHDGELRPSIVDPHGAHLGDAAPKLKALAKYADEHRDGFERIYAIGIEREEDGKKVLVALDLKLPSVRSAVNQSPADTDSIKSLFAQHGFVYGEIVDL